MSVDAASASDGDGGRDGMGEADRGADGSDEADDDETASRPRVTDDGDAGSDGGAALPSWRPSPRQRSASGGGASPMPSAAIGAAAAGMAVMAGSPGPHHRQQQQQQQQQQQGQGGEYPSYLSAEHLRNLPPELLDLEPTDELLKVGVIRSQIRSQIRRLDLRSEEHHPS